MRCWMLILPASARSLQQASLQTAVLLLSASKHSLQAQNALHCCYRHSLVSIKQHNSAPPGRLLSMQQSTQLYSSELACLAWTTHWLASA